MQFTKRDKQALHERLNFLDRLEKSKDVTVTAAVNPVMADAYVASQEKAKEMEDMYKELSKNVEDINTDHLANKKDLVNKFKLKEEAFSDYSIARPYSSRLYDDIEENLFDSKDILYALIDYLPDDTIKEFGIHMAIWDDKEEVEEETTLTESKKSLKEGRSEEPLYNDLYDEIYLQLASSAPFTDKQIYNKGIYNDQYDMGRLQLGIYNWDNVPHGYIGIAVCGKDESELAYARKIADKYSDWVTVKEIDNSADIVGKENKVGIAILVPEDAEALNLDDEKIRKAKADTIARRRANREAKKAAQQQK